MLTISSPTNSKSSIPTIPKTFEQARPIKYTVKVFLEPIAEYSPEGSNVKAVDEIKSILLEQTKRKYINVSNIYAPFSKYEYRIIFELPISLSIQDKKYSIVLSDVSYDQKFDSLLPMIRKCIDFDDGMTIQDIKTMNDTFVEPTSYIFTHTKILTKLLTQTPKPNEPVFKITIGVKSKDPAIAVTEEDKSPSIIKTLEAVLSFNQPSISEASSDILTNTNTTSLPQPSVQLDQRDNSLLSSSRRPESRVTNPSITLPSTMKNIPSSRLAEPEQAKLIEDKTEDKIEKAFNQVIDTIGFFSDDIYKSHVNRHLRRILYQRPNRLDLPTLTNSSSTNSISNAFTRLYYTIDNFVQELTPSMNSFSLFD